MTNRIGLFEAIAIVGTAWATAVAQIIRRPSLEDDMAERRRQADEYGRELDDETKRVNRETRKNRRANWVAVEMLPYWQNGNKKTNRRG